MKSHGDEPSPASATAAERELFRAESKNAARAGGRKSGAEDRAAEECLVSVNEAARLLAVSVSTLYGWVWQRRISFVKLGRAVRFDTTDLREFVKENRVEGRGQANNV
jgi:excisionase family DNA binding protein